jgi:hypothetical protein
MFSVTNWAHDLPHLAQGPVFGLGASGPWGPEPKYNQSISQPHLAELHMALGVLSLVDFHKRTYKCTVFKFPFLWRILLWQLVEELFVTRHGSIIETVFTGRNPLHTLPVTLCLLAVWMKSYQPATKQWYSYNSCIPTTAAIYKELQLFLLVWTVCRTQTMELAALVSSEFIQLRTEWNILFVTL